MRRITNVPSPVIFIGCVIICKKRKFSSAPFPCTCKQAERKKLSSTEPFKKKGIYPVLFSIGISGNPWRVLIGFFKTKSTSPTVSKFIVFLGDFYLWVSTFFLATVNLEGANCPLTLEGHLYLTLLSIADFLIPHLPHFCQAHRMSYRLLRFCRPLQKLSRLYWQTLLISHNLLSPGQLFPM